MGDDLKRRRPEDPTKINISQPWEIDYWCDYFHCTKSQLIAAVNAVGPLVKDVSDYLKRHK